MQENKTGETGESDCAYRFLTLVIPLNAFLGTAWIWFSLRSLEREREREREREIS